MEPVQAFQQATWRQDTGIERLRALAQEVPGEMPKIGHAWLDNALNKATAEGGFRRGASLFEDWQTLGPETKKILFPDPAHVRALDHFFLAAKRMGEEYNSSRSGTLMLIGQGAGSATAFVKEPVTGTTYILGAGALAGLLHSPAGVWLLTHGLEVPAGKTAAAALVAKELLGMAGRGAQRGTLPLAS